MGAIFGILTHSMSVIFDTFDSLVLYFEEYNQKIALNEYFSAKFKIAY